MYISLYISILDEIRKIKFLQFKFDIYLNISQFNIYPVFKIKTSRHLSNVYYSNFTYFSDQNRNKTKTKNNQKSANQQADVISLNNKQEVTRLEALCETRTKELNYARLQMKSNLQAFDVMTVMVQYLSEDVGSTV